MGNFSPILSKVPHFTPTLSEIYDSCHLPTSFTFRYTHMGIVDRPSLPTKKPVAIGDTWHAVNTSQWSTWD